MSESKRLVSLDVFRGLTIMSMILVNNPGSWQYVYPPLRHAQWNGWTPTDLIFPFFLFIVGVAIKLSLDKYLTTEIIMHKIYFRIFKRTILLFALGLFLNGFPDFDWGTLRIPGVLQRIAVCYMVASLIYLKVAEAEIGKVQVSVLPLFIIIPTLLVVYYVLMKFVPVPGFGAGRIDLPAGNLAAYLDKNIFGAHVWQYSRPGDPEGLLSTIPAIATMLAGLVCGWWLKTEREKMDKLVKMIPAGGACVVLAYLVHPFFPINKNLWTSSYVLLTSGLALVVLGICYYYTDVLGKKLGTKPFIIFGANAITVYFLSSVGADLISRITLPSGGGSMDVKSFLYDYVFQPPFGNYLGSLAFAVGYVLLWLGVMSVFYKKKIFIKV
jgi:predicted acyltransferase